MSIFGKSPVLQELKKLGKEEKLKKQAENYQGTKWKETLEQRSLRRYF